MKRDIFLRSPYNYDMDVISEITGQMNLLPSKTQQQFKDEVDINTIVNRFGLTGELPDGARMPSYADFDGVLDYHTAMNAVRGADEAFMAIPADLRAFFQNDPQNLIEFLADPQNRDQALELGLIDKPQPQMGENPTKPAAPSEQKPSEKP